MTGLRPRDVAALPRETTRTEILNILTSSYENFRTCVVAEATRPGVPVELRRTLRRPEWSEDWIDALIGAEASLQVAVLRARYEDGPDADSTLSNTTALAAVRTRLHQARAQAKRRSRLTSEEGTEHALRARAAMRRIVAAHRQQYIDFLRREMAERGIDSKVRQVVTGTTAELHDWAVAVGAPPAVMVTGRVRELQRLDDRAFRDVVASDVQGNPEEPELSHPLTLDRWGAALQDLARMTAEHLGLPVRPMAVVADADLTVAGLDQADAYRRINRLRFMVHTQQRWLEQKSRVRRFRRDVALWRKATLDPAKERARDELRRTYASEYEQALSDPDLLTAPDQPPQAAATGPAPTAAPLAAYTFSDKAERLGWEISFERDAEGRQVRVDARRDGSLLRVAFGRKSKGQGKLGWEMAFVGVRLPGGGWVRLPTAADAVDLAELDGEELALRVSQYVQADADRNRWRRP